MNIRETNAKNRQALDVYHTSGKHGSAKVAHMMNKKRTAAGAKPVTRVDVWIETHTCKDGSTSKTVAPIMGQVKQLNSAQTEEDSEDILQDPLTKVLGLDKGGRTRGVGSTVSQTQVLASIPAQEKLAELEKERNAKDQTINVLKSDVEYLKSTVADIKDWCTRNQHGSSCSQHEAASTSSVATTPAPNDCSFSNNVLYRLLDSQKKVAAHGKVIVQDVQFL
ncbi:hypothetical protein IFM89_025381 [Coptis chinensis]|uniref:Uncharacterized protein n=1 Tax=Coptis chinensis TaxID=261450 RepID=A0A835LRG5_9MAGN|nr:hypothetical protein IFM89_025381 [Coptis chinensis]